MNNNIIELPSENDKTQPERNNTPSFANELKRVTRGGNLKIEQDRIWEYYYLIKSENLFERLFLDIEENAIITNEKVISHYTEIEKYLDEWKERESSGISFSESHKGNTINELIELLKESKEKLRNRNSREEVYESYKREKKSKGYKSIQIMIRIALTDKILTNAERSQIFEEGIRGGLSYTEIEEYLEEELKVTGSEYEDGRKSKSSTKKGEMEISTAKEILGLTEHYNEEELELKYENLRKEYKQSLSSQSEKIREIAKKELESLNEAYSLLIINTKTEKKQNIIKNEPKNEKNELTIEKKIDNPLSILDLVFVEGGTFTMGCTSEQGSDCDDWEKPTSSVKVSSFYIGKYEVTQKLYQEVTGKSPSNWKGENLPVEEVSWYDAIEFCNLLSEKEGLTPVYTIDKNTKDRNNESEDDDLKYTVSTNWNANGYRLPTEAEWEYAARGGNKSKGYKYSGSNEVGDVGWYDSNSGDKTHPVGTKQPNELGIYDMSGNVWEWCWDWYDDYTSDSKTNPRGAASGSYRVCRGGSWFSYAVSLRTARRGSDTPTGSNHVLGFRVVRTAQ